jgi:hypothetical protein
MAQHVLPVRSAVFQTPEQFDQLGMDVENADFLAGRFARLANAFLQVAFALLNDFLHAGRVDAAVGDKLLEGQSSHFAPQWVETGNDDCLGRVVHDDVHAGQLFEGADVSPLAADDPPFHFIVGQLDHRDGGFADLFRGGFLYGERDDLARLFIRHFFRLRLDAPDQGRLILAQLGFKLIEEEFFRLVGGHARDLFATGHKGALQRFGLFAGAIGLGKPLVQVLFFVTDRLLTADQLLLAPVELFLAAFDPRFDPLDFDAAFLEVPLEFVLTFRSFFPLFFFRLPDVLGGLALGVFDQTLCLFAGSQCFSFSELGHRITPPIAPAAMATMAVATSSNTSMDVDWTAAGNRTSCRVSIGKGTLLSGV